MLCHAFMFGFAMSVSSRSRLCRMDGPEDLDVMLHQGVGELRENAHEHRATVRMIRRRHQASMLLVCACVVVMVLAGRRAGSMQEGASAQNRDRIQWGLYQILWSRRYGDQLDVALAKFASKPDYIMFYRDLGRSFPKRVVDTISRRGATTIVSLELWQWHGRHTGSYLPAINAGKFDAFFRQWARDAKADGRRVLLRFGFEFNGNWFTWGGDPTGFVRAWHRARDIFDKVGATNVEWVWAPNIVSVPNTTTNSMHSYYPGDTYVEWIGVDGYNFGDHHDIWHKWQTFAEVFDEVLSDFQRRYADKPVIIAEFACAPGLPGRQAEWIRQAYRNLLARPQVKAVVWFNLDKHEEGEPNWRLDRAADSLRAFNETFAAPRGQHALP